MASILVMEERRGTHQVLKSALLFAGHDVVVAETTSASGHYDLAMVDCSKENVARAVAAAGRLSSRVVLYTEPPDDAVCAAAREAGALGYIAPSQSPVVLLEEVQRFLRH